MALGLLGSILAVAGVFLPWVKPNPILLPSAPPISGWEAADALAKIGDPRGVEPLVKSLRDRYSYSDR